MPKQTKSGSKTSSRKKASKSSRPKSTKTTSVVKRDYKYEISASNVNELFDYDLVLKIQKKILEYFGPEFGKYVEKPERADLEKCIATLIQLGDIDISLLNTKKGFSEVLIKTALTKRMGDGFETFPGKSSRYPYDLDVQSVAYSLALKLEPIDMVLAMKKTKFDLAEKEKPWGFGTALNVGEETGFFFEDYDVSSLLRKMNSDKYSESEKKIFQKFYDEHNSPDGYNLAKEEGKWEIGS